MRDPRDDWVWARGWFEGRLRGVEDSWHGVWDESGGDVELVSV